MKALASRIEAAAAGGTGTVELASLAHFEWDMLFLFMPFTGEDELHENLGADWAGVARTNISSRDDIVLLVFVSDENVVRLVKFPRRLGDFSEIETDGGLAPSEARFLIERRDGRMVLRLAPTT